MERACARTLAQRDGAPFEAPSTGPQKEEARGEWRARQDSNLWPSAPEATGCARNIFCISYFRRVLTSPANSDGPDRLSGTNCCISRPPKWDSKTAVAARIASGT